MHHLGFPFFKIIFEAMKFGKSLFGHHSSQYKHQQLIRNRTFPQRSYLHLHMIVIIICIVEGTVNRWIHETAIVTVGSIFSLIVTAGTYLWYEGIEVRVPSERSLRHQFVPASRTLLVSVAKSSDYALRAESMKALLNEKLMKFAISWQYQIAFKLNGYLC